MLEQGIDSGSVYSSIRSTLTEVVEYFAREIINTDNEYKKYKDGEIIIETSREPSLLCIECKVKVKCKGFIFNFAKFRFDQALLIMKSTGKIVEEIERQWGDACTEVKIDGLSW